MNEFYAVWLIVSGVVALWVAWLGWHRRTASGALALTALMLALAVWSLAYALHWLRPAPEACFWLKMTYFGVVTAPVAFFVLVQFFIGRGRRGFAAIPCRDPLAVPMQQERAAADAAGLRLDQRQHHLHCDRGVECAAAGLQHLIAGVGSQRVGRLPVPA